jgi:hypothetical protein
LESEKVREERAEERGWVSTMGPTGMGEREEWRLEEYGMRRLGKREQWRSDRGRDTAGDASGIAKNFNCNISLKRFSRGFS